MNPDSPEPVGPPPPIRVRGQACDMGPPLAVRLPEIVIERDVPDGAMVRDEDQGYILRWGGQAECAGLPFVADVHAAEERDHP